jgi:hypothetical protein
VGWYRVIKRIKGRRYLYMQRTYRENGKVKTECFYVSALNDDNGKGGTWARFSRRKALISPPRKRCTLGRPFLRRVSGLAIFLI